MRKIVKVGSQAARRVRMTCRQRLFHLLALVLLVVAAAALPGCGFAPGAPPLTLTSATTSDRLRSWNDVAVKHRLLEFVDRVTTDGPDFVPVEDRIAVFDNDGTLWQEKPNVEAAFALARVEQRAKADPSLREKEPFRALLEQDVEKLRTLYESNPLELLKVFTTTNAGMTDGAFAAEVRRFLTTARHPRFKVPYTDLSYVPMQELLSLLRARDFTIYICSAAETSFIRVFANSLYGVPPEHVIGSRLDKSLVIVDGKTVLRREPTIETINDKDQKPIGIDRRLGRRPLFAAGNVGNAGDIAMLRYTRDRPGPSFTLVIHHDDANREVAYDEKDGATLTAAADYGFNVVSMKNDWKTVFGIQ